MKAPELKVFAEFLDAKLKALLEEHKLLAERFNDLRREYEKELALLHRDIEDIKKWKSESQKQKEERSRRAWAFGPNLTAAAITVILAPISVYAWNYLVAYFNAPRA